MVKNKIKEESLRSVASWRIFRDFFDGEKRGKNSGKWNNDREESFSVLI